MSNDKNTGGRQMHGSYIFFPAFLNWHIKLPSILQLWKITYLLTEYNTHLITISLYHIKSDCAIHNQNYAL